MINNGERRDFGHAVSSFISSSSGMKPNLSFLMWMRCSASRWFCPLRPHRRQTPDRKKCCFGLCGSCGAADCGPAELSQVQLLLIGFPHGFQTLHVHGKDTLHHISGRRGNRPLWGCLCQQVVAATKCTGIAIRDPI